MVGENHPEKLGFKHKWGYKGRVGLEAHGKENHESIHGDGQ